MGDAVGVRKSRHQGYAASERAKDLAIYLETGVRHFVTPSVSGAFSI